MNGPIRRFALLRRPSALAVLLLAVTPLLPACRGATGQERDAPSARGSAGGAPTEAPYPAAVIEPLRTALAAYEEVRARLADDDPEGVATPAGRLLQSLRHAAEAAGEGATARRLRATIDAAQQLAAGGELAAQRQAFAEVSHGLIALAAGDRRLSHGLHVFACPMVEGFNRWMQPSPEVENPFMGQAMSSCGTAADWAVEAPPASDGAEGPPGVGDGEDDIAYYTCSMHPSVRNDGPGTCPICSMDLVPVTREEAETGVIRVDGAQRQTIGVTTAAVARRSLRVRIRAVGKVRYDERRLTDVTLKLGGWIGRLEVDAPGQRVERGETLFTLYSPQLYAAEEELLTALASQQTARRSAAPERLDDLVAAARKRLRLWGLEGWQVDELAARRDPLEQVPIVSPASGYVVEKDVVEGAAVEPGQRLYRIAGLDRVWVEAEVYESDLPLVERGQGARVTLPYLPGAVFNGEVAFVYPYLDDATRSGRVRIELANPSLELKPEMYADVELTRDLGERLVVPEDAVLYAGERRFVFLDLGDGRLQPRGIEVGVRSGEAVEVLSGLTDGDVVVTSGNFLIGAEARLKLAMEHWR